MTFGQLQHKRLMFSEQSANLGSLDKGPATRVLTFHVKQSIRAANRAGKQHMVPQEALDNMVSTPGSWQLITSWLDASMAQQVEAPGEDEAGEVSDAPLETEQPGSFQAQLAVATTPAVESSKKNSGGQKKKKKKQKKKK